MAKIIKVKSKEDFCLLTPASEALAKGELVAFPTETVYGLGANALDDKAVASIFSAKGRPQDNPLIVHIAEKEDIFPLVKAVPPIAQTVLDKFMPGPITIVLEKSDIVPDRVTAGGKTVAIRIPENEIAQKLINAAKIPVAAPSANTSGRPSPTKASHVEEDLGESVSYIIDGGDCRVGLESTVLDLTVDPPQILRPGGVSCEELEKVIGKVVGYKQGECDDSAPKSPGMKYRHYAPRAKMTVFQGENPRQAIKDAIKELDKSEKVYVLCAGSNQYENACTINCGSSPEDFSKNLFAALRQADTDGATVVFAEFPFSSGGIVTALFNRINKSAGGNIVLCK